MAQKRTAKDFVLSQRPLCECRRHLGDSRWFIWDRSRADRITGYAKSPTSAWALAMNVITGEISGPEGRAEAQSSDTATRDHSNETVSSRAESEPAVSVAPPLTPND